MQNHRHNHELCDLADALGELRDSLILINMAIKDRMADIQTPERKAICKLVEQQIDGLRRSAR